MHYTSFIQLYLQMTALEMRDFDFCIEYKCYKNNMSNVSQYHARLGFLQT